MATRDMAVVRQDSDGLDSHLRRKPGSWIQWDKGLSSRTILSVENRGRGALSGADPVSLG
jgi:hypothetical protein